MFLKNMVAIFFILFSMIFVSKAFAAGSGSYAAEVPDAGTQGMGNIVST